MKALQVLFATTLIPGCVLEKAKEAKVTAGLSASEVNAGDDVKLTWSSRDAKSCVLKHGTIVKEIPLTGEESFKAFNDEVFSIRCEGQKDGEASVSLKVYPLAEARLSASVAQIYLGQNTEITWDCKNAEQASLTANGEAFGDGLSLTGASLYSPNAGNPSADNPSDDVEFALTCKNKLGRETRASTVIKVIAETSVKPNFGSFADLDAAIDTGALKTDCGASCVYADFEPARFVRGTEGTYTATDAYRAEIEKNLRAAPGKVALYTSRTVAFDFPGTFGYGHRESVNDAAQQKLCDQNFPLAAKGATFPSAPEFIDELESGSESLGVIPQTEPVAFDIEVSTKALAGVMKAGTEASLSYKVGRVEAQSEADFTDFDKVKGSYKLQKDGSLILPEANRMMAFGEDDYEVRASCSFPSDGYLVNTPAGVNSDVTAYAIAGTFFPEPARYSLNPNMFDPKHGLCTKTPYFYWRGMPGDPCSYIQARNINEKPGYVMPGSPRVASGLGIVQCKRYFGALADAYGLGDDWTATAELQYFITDARFKNGCDGASCAGKEERTSENDWRFQDIEPARNKCVDRWAGLSWNDYQSRLSAACTSTQIYKDAVARKEAKANDQNFANACGSNPTCKGALDAMVGLTRKFSPQALSEIIDRESAAMQKAKNEGRSYFITDAKLAPELVSEARAQIAVIEVGLDTVQSLHASNKSNWISGNLIVHANQSVTGFDSYTESRNTLPAYKRQIDRINALIVLDLREVSCSYDARGRFRKYELPKLLGDVKLNSVRQNTVKTKVKTDTKVSQ
jgi:hypothetical protein